MTRLRSSGIDQSSLRKPDSMWQTVIPRLAAATRAGECRVDVSCHDHEVRLQFAEDALQRRQGVLGRSSVELDVRPGQRELREEDVLHDRVVVLAGVNEPLLDVAKPLERVVDRRDLHVVRPRADHMDDEMSAGHSEESRSALDEHFGL